MQQIKFRTWDFDEESFSYSFLGGAINISLSRGLGLTDKNGTEIYEYDIISTNLGPGVVEYDKKYAKFSANGLDFGVTIDVDKIEVLGNIYQNPELLK